MDEARVPLQEFYVITMHSMHVVRATGNGRADRPSIVRLVTTEHSLEQPVGQMTSPGCLVGIANTLVVFPRRPPPGYEHNPQMVDRRFETWNPMQWHGVSTNIAGAFLRGDEAQNAMQRPGPKGFRDKEWVHLTRETLAAIGPNHPDFPICLEGPTALFPDLVQFFAIPEAS